MDRRVMIMCDTEASGITGVINDSYLDHIERRPNGGATVIWTDLPDQAMIFDDAVAAEEFCRDSPLEMFVVSFVPVPAPPPRETEADFLDRLHRMVHGGEAEAAQAQSVPDPQPLGEPDLSKPGALADEMRRMGLM